MRLDGIDYVPGRSPRVHALLGFRPLHLALSVSSALPSLECVPLGSPVAGVLSGLLRFNGFSTASPGHPLIPAATIQKVESFGDAGAMGRLRTATASTLLASYASSPASARLSFVFQ